MSGRETEELTGGPGVDAFYGDALSSTSRPGQNSNPPPLNPEHLSQEYFERVVRGAINRRGCQAYQQRLIANPSDGGFSGPWNNVDVELYARCSCLDQERVPCMCCGLDSCSWESSVASLLRGRWSSTFSS